jgi:L-rhamnose mutarotase
MFGPTGSTSTGRATGRSEALEVNARWQAAMAPFFELPGEERPDTGLERLEEVFHLD